MVSEHIIKSYDEELRRFGNTITQLGGLAEIQLTAAIDAVMKRDSRPPPPETGRHSVLISLMWCPKTGSTHEPH